MIQDILGQIAHTDKPPLVPVRFSPKVSWLRFVSAGYDAAHIWEGPCAYARL